MNGKNAKKYDFLQKLLQKLRQKLRISAIFGAEASAEASADSVHFWAASALLPKRGKRVKKQIFSASAEASGHPYRGGEPPGGLL